MYPPKCNEKNPVPHDKNLYKTRHVIENIFCYLKDWKGVAFRGNCCAPSFHSIFALALTIIFMNVDRA